MAFVKPDEILRQAGVASGMRVADLGSGSGHYTVAAANLVAPNGHVYAVEIQHDLLTKARSLDKEKCKLVSFLHGDIEADHGTHLKEASVDVVILSNVLFQTPKKDAVLNEAHRILTVGGRLILVDWSDSSGRIGPEPSMIVDPDEIRKRAGAHGFSYDRLLDAGDHHWGMLLYKRI